MGFALIPPETSKGKEQVKVLVRPMRVSGAIRPAALAAISFGAFLLMTLGLGLLANLDDGFPSDKKGSSGAQADCERLASSTLDGPIIISGTGCYFLSRDLQVDHQEVISILADNVELDLDGHTVSCGSRPDSYSVGIYALGTNISVYNGKILGCTVGIRFDRTPKPYGANFLYELSISDSFFRGMLLHGDGFTVKKSTINGVGADEFFDGGFAFGIEIIGDYCLVEGVFISGIESSIQGEGVGVSLSQHDLKSCAVRDSSILGSDKDHYFSTFGIWRVGGQVAIEGNTIRGFAIPFTGSHDFAELLNVNKTGEMHCPILFEALQQGTVDEYQNSFELACPMNVTENLANFRSTRNPEFLYLAGMWGFEVPALASSNPACPSKSSIYLGYISQAAELGASEALRTLPRFRDFESTCQIPLSKAF